MRTSTLSLVLALLPSIAACQDSDAAALRIRLQADLSGEINASALSLPEDPAPLESASSGVEWRDRARLLFSAGRFEHLSKLAIEDLRFSPSTTPEGLTVLRIVLPRGEQARWYKLFTTAEAERRQRLVRALDPEGRADKIGAQVKVVIRTPSPISSSGLRPSVRGAKAEHGKEEATLTVSLEALQAGEAELVWDVVW